MFPSLEEIKSNTYHSPKLIRYYLPRQKITNITINLQNHVKSYVNEVKNLHKMVLNSQVNVDNRRVAIQGMRNYIGKKTDEISTATRPL